VFVGRQRKQINNEWVGTTCELLDFVKAKKLAY